MIVKIGNPVKQIVATAQEGNFDLIIMGTHGHGKMEERIIGSTASDVIRLSYVPVTVIRLPQEKTHSHQEKPSKTVNVQQRRKQLNTKQGGGHHGRRPSSIDVPRRKAMATNRSFEKNFAHSISKGITLVDFNAPWCKPCRAQEPIINALKKIYRGAANVAMLNIDENREIAFKLGIQSIPTIIIYKDGMEMNRFIGLQNNETLAKALQRLVGQPDTGNSFSRH